MSKRVAQNDAPESRAEAIKLVLEQGFSVVEAAARLNMNHGTLGYCSHGYRKLLEQFKLRASMSRRGNCYDNAPMESFWGSLKNERVHHHRYETRLLRPKRQFVNVSKSSTTASGVTHT